MDNKRMLIGMAVALAVVLGYFQLLGYLDSQHPEWGLRKRDQATTQPTTAPVEPASTQPVAQSVAPATLTTSTTAPVVTAAPAPTASTQPVAPQVAAALRAQGADRPVSTDLGSRTPNDPTYAMGVSLSPRGASLDGVVLNEFKKSAKSDERYVFQQPYEVDPTVSRPLATRSITVDGVEASLRDLIWTLEQSSETAATYATDLIDASGSPVVRARKTFQLRPKSADPKGVVAYELLVTQSFENLTDRQLKLKTTFNGPTTPPREMDRGPDLQVLGAYDDEGLVKLVQHYTEAFTTKQPSLDLTKNEAMPFLWGGGASVYFQALLRPEPLVEKRVDPGYIEKFEARTLSPDVEPSRHAVLLTFQTTELAVDAGKTLSLPMRLFLGPKQRKLLNNDYFAGFPLSYNQTLVITSGMCGICTFQWLINLLVGMLRGFHWLFGGFAGAGDWGLAIIGLVCVVRLCLHPITKRSQISMMKMGKMAPEMERLKKKYGDNKEELNRAMMGLYKEQGLTPILGCLPMFLQMPIWIALWQSLQTTFELRQASFLWGFTWIDDLAKPDHLITFPAIHLPFGITLDALNLLPILLAVVFYLQAEIQGRLQPAGTPEQEQQKKMMKWMSLLFPIFLYTGPSGLNLYILTSTTIGIIESKVIRNHIKQREEAEKAGPVIVDVKPTRESKRRKDNEADPKKRGGLLGFLAELQARAEQMRDQNRK